ncbi:type II toxin-antitoxin system VapC family toxin [Larkinella soli]|uniref:type II toxin-antitoxin system VapC family toxin n=1 Tax=Larkinella soli TaxID=1770527 RepID=UPI000FFB4EDC|nr:type II toxin-antitoxin system VapC family toxin [Larkinella soli]
MRYLLDTHIFIWTLTNDLRLTASTLQVFSDPGNEFYLSTESIREIAIKSRSGKLQIPDDFEEVVTKIRLKGGIKLLPIRVSHLLKLHQLDFPAHHRDPFDHMIICQAIVEKMTVISSDQNFPFYVQCGLKLFQN